MTSSTHNNNDYDPAAAVLLLQQQLLLRDLVLVSAILGIKCAAIAQAIGCLRVTTVQYCAPEDLLLDPPRNRRIRQASRQERNATPTPSSSSSSSSVELTWRERLQRIQQNDVENIPIFLILAAVYSAALITLHNHHHINLDHPASSWMLVEARPVLWVFGGARLLHTLCYLTKLQPHRTLAFATGLAAHYYVCGLLLRWAIVFGNINSRHNNRSATTTSSWFYHYLPVLVVLPLLAQMMYYVVESPVCLWRFFVPVVARDSRWKDDAKKQS